MEELFQSYSVSDVVVFAVIFAVAIKESVTFFDWGKERLRKAFDKSSKSEQEKQAIEDRVDKLDKLCSETTAAFGKINKQIDMLIESDKEDIKSYIVKEHHYFVYTQGWIDDYSMECMERRFAVYRQEHGNSFIEGLMNEIRALPKQPPETDRQKYVGTAEFVKNAKHTTN